MIDTFLRFSVPALLTLALGLWIAYPALCWIGRKLVGYFIAQQWWRGGVVVHSGRGRKAA